MFADSGRSQTSVQWSLNSSLISYGQEHNFKNIRNSGYILCRITLLVYFTKNIYLTVALDVTRFKSSLW